MRYSMIDLQCEDIMWFGVDEHGHILAFTSGGSGPVPEFVCRSKEETAQLEAFFLEKLDHTSTFIMEIPDDDSPLANDAQVLAGKGVYVYDVSYDENPIDDYELISSPTDPVLISDLPADIVAILRDHVIGGPAGSKIIRVQHAF